MSENRSISTWPVSTVVALNEHVLAELREEKTKPPDAVLTSFPGVNRSMMGAGGRLGLAHGWQVLIGGCANKGKTSIAFNWTIRALKAGENVLFVALEGDLESFAARIVLS